MAKYCFRIIEVKATEKPMASKKNLFSVSTERRRRKGMLKIQSKNRNDDDIGDDYTCSKLFFSYKVCTLNSITQHTNSGSS